MGIHERKASSGKVGVLTVFAVMASLSVPLEASAQEQAADDAGAPAEAGAVDQPEIAPVTPTPEPPPNQTPQPENPSVVRSDPYQPQAEQDRRQQAEQDRLQQWEQYRRQQWEQYRRRQAKPKRQWYGWQTLIVDGASVALLVVGSGEEGTALGALLAYEIGPPSIHWAHGNVGEGFASLGMRLGGTALLIAGVASAYGGGGGGGGGAALLGFAVMVAAIPIDAAAFAWEDAPTYQPDARQGHPLSALRIAPVVDVERRSGELFMMGNF